MARPKKSTKEKVQKEYPEFASEVDSLQLADLEKKISTYAKEEEKVAQAREEDSELNALSEQKAELEGPYRDAKKAIRLKIKYLIELVKDKGGDA